VVIRRAHLDRTVGVASSLAALILCAVAIHAAEAKASTAPVALASVHTATSSVPYPYDTGWG
jgi:hypothetical protein